MKTILDDPDGFLEQGGWDFLSDEQPGSDQEGASDDDSEGFETPDESEFEVQHVDLYPTTRILLPPPGCPQGPLSVLIICWASDSFVSPNSGPSRCHLERDQSAFAAAVLF